MLNFFLPNRIKFSIFNGFSLQPTWPPFGRLTDTQVSTRTRQREAKKLDFLLHLRVLNLYNLRGPTK